MRAQRDDLPTAYGWRSVVRRGVLLLAAGACVAGPCAGAAAAQLTATTAYTAPGVHEFIVPAGVTTIQVTAIGAPGGIDGYPLLNAITNQPECHLDNNHAGNGASVSATLPVSPGEVLMAGVGTAGASGCAGSAGGTGGGGSGGQDPSFGGGLGGGGGGGGASDIGLPEVSPGFQSPLLLVAAGGGGAGAIGVGNGGDAGQRGSDAPPSGTGGSAGTLTSGGAGGSSACGAPGVVGGPGSFGLGGSAPAPGGGGGGGGYFGGGAGGDANGSGCPGYAGGGGGGSSYIAPAATNTSGPTVTAAPPEVVITYPVPTADEAPTVLRFGTQPQDTAGTERQLTVSNNGSAPLLVSAIGLAGANPGDYLIADRCQSLVAPGASCVIGVRFAPQSEGASSAALTLSTNAVTASPPISLSGTGGPLPQGPPGPKGSPGATGPKGPAGPTATVVCRSTKTGKLVCTLEFATGSFTVRPAVQSASFQVQRGRRTITRGRMTLRSGMPTQARLGRLVRARYMLTVTTVQAGHSVVLLREPFVVR